MEKLSSGVSGCPPASDIKLMVKAFVPDMNPIGNSTELKS